MAWWLVVLVVGVADGVGWWVGVGVGALSALQYGQRIAMRLCGHLPCGGGGVPVGWVAVVLCGSVRMCGGGVEGFSSLSVSSELRVTDRRSDPHDEEKGAVPAPCIMPPLGRSSAPARGWAIVQVALSDPRGPRDTGVAPRYTPTILRGPPPGDGTRAAKEGVFSAASPGAARWRPASS